MAKVTQLYPQPFVRAEVLDVRPVAAPKGYDCDVRLTLHWGRARFIIVHFEAVRMLEDPINGGHTQSADLSAEASEFEDAVLVAAVMAIHFETHGYQGQHDTIRQLSATDTQTGPKAPIPVVPRWNPTASEPVSVVVEGPECGYLCLGWGGSPRAALSWAMLDDPERFDRPDGWVSARLVTLTAAEWRIVRDLTFVGPQQGMERLTAYSKLWRPFYERGQPLTRDLVVELEPGVEA